MEGANGIGRPLTQRLLVGGEQVLDMPTKLAAQALNRMHWLFLELLPGEAPVKKSASTRPCWPASGPATSPGRPAAGVTDVRTVLPFYLYTSRFAVWDASSR